MKESRLLEDIRGQERSLARVLAWQRGEGHAALLEAGQNFAGGSEDCGYGDRGFAACGVSVAV